MSDRTCEIIAPLVQDAYRVRWDDSATIRRRGESRARSRRVALGTAVIVAFALVGGVVWADVRSSDPPPRVAAPPGDSGPHPREALIDSWPTMVESAVQEGAADDRGLSSLFADCGYEDYTRIGPAERAGRWFRDASGRSELRQETYRYRTGFAPGHFADVEVAVARCDRFQSPGDPGRTTTLSVVDQDTGGDRSILVAESTGSAPTTYHLVMSVGEYETRITMLNVSVSTARDVARAALAGLCRAAREC